MGRIILGFALTVAVIAAVLYFFVVGPDRVQASIEPCPAAPALDYSIAFTPDSLGPDLCAASTMGNEEAVAYIMTRAIPVRTFVATEIQAECIRSGTQMPACDAGLGDPALEAEIDQRLPALVAEHLRTEHDLTSAEIWVERPFPWTGFLALKSAISPYAALSFQYPSETPFTSARLEQEYGPPPERSTDAQGNDNWTYRRSAPSHEMTMTFVIDPRSGAIRSQRIGVTRG